MLACGTPNADPTQFITLSWIDADPTKSWLGCTWTNGETKEVYSTTYGELAAGSSYTNNWRRKPGANESFALTRKFVGTAGFNGEGKAQIFIRPVGLGGLADYFINYFSITSTFNYTYLGGLISIGDVGQGTNDYLIKNNQKNNTFTDVNDVTYTWTQGNGW
jgi:hypothetical protein